MYNEYIIIIPSYEGEIWKLITNKEVNNIKPNNYYISTHGRVYSLISNMFLTLVETNRGYLAVNLKSLLPGNHVITRTIHRLVMLAFNYISDKDLVVNHKDGNKHNNHISNLEWMTQKENVAHAFENNLRGYGENSTRVIISQEQAKEICSLYTSGMSIAEIAHLKEYERHIVSNIIYGNSWIELQNDDRYNLGKRHDKLVTFTNEQVHSICRHFVNYKNQGYKLIDIYRLICSDLDLEQNKNIYSLLSFIYYRRTYKDISCQYNY